MLVLDGLILEEWGHAEVRQVKPGGQFTSLDQPRVWSWKELVLMGCLRRKWASWPTGPIVRRLKFVQAGKPGLQEFYDGNGGCISAICKWWFARHVLRGWQRRGHSSSRAGFSAPLILFRAATFGKQLCHFALCRGDVVWWENLDDMLEAAGTWKKKGDNGPCTTRPCASRWATPK